MIPWWKEMDHITFKQIIDLWHSVYFENNMSQIYFNNHIDVIPTISKMYSFQILLLLFNF